jgi:hypothetical protein
MLTSAGKPWIVVDHERRIVALNDHANVFASTHTA